MQLSEFLLAWRTTLLRDREVVDALVHPAHAAPSAALALALERWPGHYYWSDEPDGRHLILTRPLGRPRRERWPLHGVLFLATLLTTTFAGAVLAGAIPYANPIDFFSGGHIALSAFARAWSKGLAFSLPLLAIGGDTAGLGDSLVTLALRRLVYGGAPALLLSPLAFAGWVGMFVTMLNLLPISQLDGGHILYAALPRWHGRVALALWLPLLVLGKFWWGWWVWLVLVLALSRGRLGHPPVLDAYRPMPPSRRPIAWSALGLFALTFAPVPFRI